MSRILLLLVFMIWMAWSPSHPAAPPALPLGPYTTSPVTPLLLFLGGYVALVLLMGGWSRLVARRVGSDGLHRSVRRFNRAMDVARAVVPAWFAMGVMALNWKWAVAGALGVWGRWSYEFETPGVVVGTLPAFLAWMGLWWSQFPADRALREQNLLIQLDQAMPVHAPPGFRTYFAANLRMQLLFTIVPVLLILATKDVAGLALRPALAHVPQALRSTVEGAVMFAAAAGVFVAAPEILRRVLDTTPLPDSPLRRRLDGMCRRHGLRYRDVLLWHTQGNMGNAAVMGVLPRVRYVLLSDLLLETMTGEQIEAVFAHELGHIVHRHLMWYVVFVMTLMLSVAGPGSAVDAVLPEWANGDLGAVAMTGVGCALFLLTFGFVSRRFERQADVFAARVMEGQSAARDVVSKADHASASVGAYGAMLFASALERVAVVNNIPIASRSWCHGSIAKRMAYLRHLSDDPGHTRRFDRVMRRLYWVLVLALLVTGTWTVLVARHGM